MKTIRSDRCKRLFFAPEVARRLAERLEIRYTPKHANWHNVVEIELSVTTKQFWIGLSETSPHSDANSPAIRSAHTLFAAA